MLAPKKKQITVAVIKPDAVKAGLVDEIIEKVNNKLTSLLFPYKHPYNSLKIRD